MVFNATFNNISVILWMSVLLVEETGGPVKTTDLSQFTDKFYHIMLYTLPWSRFEFTTSVVIGTDCIGSKSNHHTITVTMSPQICLIKDLKCTTKYKTSVICSLIKNVWNWLHFFGYICQASIVAHGPLLWKFFHLELGARIKKHTMSCLGVSFVKIDHFV